MKFITRHLNLIGLLLLASFAVAATGLYFDVPQKIRAARAKASPTHYACPMHPEVTSSAPANCPLCGMKLVALSSEAAPETSMSGGGCCSASAPDSEAAPAPVTCPHMSRATNSPTCPAHAQP